MKPIDGDALFCKFWSLADPYVKQKKERGDYENPQLGYDKK